jgi:hypothetical protein
LGGVVEQGIFVQSVIQEKCNWSHCMNPDDDIFRPPTVPIEVGCLHCQQTYESYLIEWREFINHDGSKIGFWCCPMPDCDGKGFGFDIFPTDPHYRREEDGELMWCGGEEENGAAASDSELEEEDDESMSSADRNDDEDMDIPY